MLDNRGTLRAAAGHTLTMGGIDFVNTGGTLDAEGGAALLYSGGTARFLDGTLFTGAGVNRVVSNASFAGAFTSANLELANGTFSGDGAVLKGDVRFTGGVLAGTWTVAAGQVLHGSDGSTLNVAELAEADRATLGPRLAALLPDMPERMRADLVPLLLGNMDHIAEVRRTPRELDIEHREWMICMGRGFDFLHMPNLALIIGPYSPDLGDPVRKAAGIIAANMQAGRIPDDGFLLLASAPYEEIGVDRARAELKARFIDRKSTRLNSSHIPLSRMPSSA